ncbi:MAG: hypothetical protein DRH21_03635 [Deltaproteobacteria bacterium]|nr:MAG: hypothetical protein DRH21_03635 [Deltaproteobacteria bacterium]
MGKEYVKVYHGITRSFTENYKHCNYSGSQFQGSRFTVRQRKCGKYTKTIENKAIKKITNQDEAQLINYLKTIRLRVGLLFNFGAETFAMLRRIF